jgi:hypothetical protein
MQGDAQLMRAFLLSIEWEVAKSKEAFKRFRGLENAVRAFLRKEFRVPDGIETPLEVELATGRVKSLIRSSWAKKAAGTRAKRKKLKQRELIRRAKTVIEGFNKLKRPLLFGELPVQHRPVNPNKKPRRRVA